MQERGFELDRTATFPQLEFQDLRAAGAMHAVAPIRHGGLGLGVEAQGALGAWQLLRLMGRGNLSVGRIFEGHMNALNLIARYGDDAQIARAAEDAGAGHLFAIWNTEEPTNPVQLTDTPDGQSLKGCKSFCSGAGYATRGLITAKSADQRPQMVLVGLSQNTRAQAAEFSTQGMRAATTGQITLDGLEVDSQDLIGKPGDYLREPAFSGGAWRTCAVTLGGIESLIEAAREHLIARGRNESPYQQTRMGQAFIAYETIRMWTRRAALIAESGQMTPKQIAAYVNFARTAVEAAASETIRLVQRSVGLAAFLQPGTIERLMRDLGTYLRQPAPDEALTEAAAAFLEVGLPLLDQ
jgi:alkylation response protein AidB-like acyl-CoA dehydrogenase